MKQAAVSGNKGADASTTSTTDATLSQTSTEVAGPGAESNSHGVSSTATTEVEKGGASAAGPGTSELLAEATQLLKSLRMPMPTIKAMRLDDVNPTMKVMHLSKLEPNAQVLLDSGATHGLRPAVSLEEWNTVEQTQVMLADGVTSSLLLKPGTKILLSDPQQDPNRASWIVPMGCLNDLKYKLEWKDGICTLFPKYDTKVQLELRGWLPLPGENHGHQAFEPNGALPDPMRTQADHFECCLAGRYRWSGRQNDFGNGHDGQSQKGVPNPAG